MNTEINQHPRNDQNSQNNAAQPSTINRLNRSVRRSFRRARDRVFSNERNTNAGISRESTHRQNSQSSSLGSDTFRNILTISPNITSNPTSNPTLNNNVNNPINNPNHVNTAFNNPVNPSNQINTRINPIRPSGIDLTQNFSNNTNAHTNNISTPTLEETNWNSPANLEHLMEMQNNNIFEENGGENGDLDMTRNYRAFEWKNSGFLVFCAGFV